MNEKIIVPQSPETLRKNEYAAPDIDLKALDKHALPYIYPDGKIYINPNTPGLFDSASE